MTYRILLIEPNNNSYSEEALEKALGGSETIFIFLVRYLKNRQDVALDVFFRDSGNMKDFVEEKLKNNTENQKIENQKYDLVISYRDPTPLFQVQGKMNVVYLQDLPNQHIITLLNILFQQGKINKMIFLSHFQKAMYLQHMPGAEEGRHCLMFENGLDMSLFDSTIKKEKEFIYASAPNRGLDVLLDMWPDIHKELPDYTLKVIGSTKMYNVDSNDPEINKQREEFLKIGNELYNKIEDSEEGNSLEGIRLLGGLNHKELIKEFEKSKALLYPSTFAETCCHTLNCALHAGAVPVISSVGAIVEKVTNGENGVIIPGDPKSEDFKKLYVKSVVDLIKSNRIERMININRGSYLAWDMGRLVNRLLTQLVKFEDFEGNNTKVLGIICSLQDRKENRKINFRNLVWYSPIDMITDEIAGLPLDQARNAAASMAIYKNADWLLFIDSDIYVDKYFLMDMIKNAEEHNVDIVVANYPYQDRNLISTARVVRVSDNKAINCYEVKQEDVNNKEKYRFVTAGLGATLISIATLRKMGRPYFRTQNIQFRHTGEDSYFFQECAAIEAKIWLENDIPIVHIDNNGNMFGKKEHIDKIKHQIGRSILTTDNKVNKATHGKDDKTNNKENNVIQHYKNEENYKSSLIASQDSRIANIIRCSKEYMVKNGHILDLACGDGFIADRLKDNDFEVTKVDIKGGGTRGDIIEHNLEISPYPFEDNSFDGIICSEILEHLFEPMTLINECYRILKNEGIMILTVPNFNNIDNILIRHQNIVYNIDNQMSIEHIRHYTLESIKRILYNKFDVLKVMGNSPNMNPFFDNARKIINRYIDKTVIDQNYKDVLNQVCSSQDFKDQVKDQILTDIIIGECFPTSCMGLMVILKKR